MEPSFVLSNWGREIAMKFNLKLYLFCLSALSTALFFSACTKKNESKGEESTLILGTNANYPPYESTNEKGEVIGFDIDVAKAIAQKLGRKLVIKDMSFDALVLALKQQKFDIIMSGMSITPSRQKEIAMVPYQGQPTTGLSLLFWNTVPGPITSVSDLKGVGNKTVAVQIGTYMENYLNKVPDVVAKSLDSNVEIVMDLKHGKSVAALLEPHIASEVMPKHPELKRIDIALPKEEWVLGNGIGIRKDNTKLINEVQKAIQAMKQDGTLQKLETQWFEKK